MSSKFQILGLRECLASQPRIHQAFGLICAAGLAEILFAEMEQPSAHMSTRYSDALFH